MKVNKVFLVICFVMFFLLLFWPLGVVISYFLFAGLTRIIFIIVFWMIEIVNGAFLLAWLFTNRSNIKIWKFIVGIILIGIPYLVYLFTLIYVYIIQK